MRKTVQSGQHSGASSLALGETNDVLCVWKEVAAQGNIEIPE